MGLKITFAKNEDIQGILNVFNELSISNRKNILTDKNGFLVYPITKKDLEKVIKNKKDLLLVAKENSKVIGYLLSYDIDEWIKLKPNWKPSLNLKKRYIDTIFKSKTHYFRHIGRLSGYKGVGLKLENKMYEILKKRGYTLSIAEIAKFPRNIVSEKVHKARGYKEIGTIEYGDSIIWGVYIKAI